MSNIHKKTHIFLQLAGPIGSLLSSFISDYISEEEIKKINERIKYLEDNLTDFKMENYKLINRFKIREYLLKTISEDNVIFLKIACVILKDNEENFEMIVNTILSLTEEDLTTLYNNLWKKSKLDKFDKKQLKEQIEDEYEFKPDLIFDHFYRVNKQMTDKKTKGLLVGNPLTVAPGTDLGRYLYNKLEKLSYNNLITMSLYIPNANQESFHTFMCFNFTYIGMYICKAMESIEKLKSKPSFSIK